MLSKAVIRQQRSGTAATLLELCVTLVAIQETAVLYVAMLLVGSGRVQVYVATRAAGQKMQRLQYTVPL